MVEVLAMRNVFVAAALCLLTLTACSSNQSVTKSPGLVFVEQLTQLVRARTEGNVAPPNAAITLTRQDLAAINAPLIRITARKSGLVSLLSIAQRNGNAQIWKTPDNISFTLRDGFLTQTRGLSEDLYATDSSGLQAAIAGTGSATGVVRIIQRLDGANGLVPVQYRCDVTKPGAENVVVLGQSFATQHYHEVCSSADDSFTNDYWIDSRGVMRVSQQWVGNDFGHLFMERLID